MKGQPLALQAFRPGAGVAAFSLSDWDLLLRQCASANLLARLLCMLDQKGQIDLAPAPIRARLEWVRPVALRHAQAVRWEVAQIQRALAGELDQPLLLLKGAAYVMAQLPPAPGRLFSDIDILVPKPLLPSVEAALMMSGWAATHLDDYDQRYYREWMHELPPMQHSERSSAIDVHHAILPETAAARPDPAKLRAAAVPVPGQPGLAMLAPADIVLHSATHLFYDGELEHGLRDLVDLDALLRHFGEDPAFWPALAARAHELQLTRPLFYAQRYAARLLHTPVPPALPAALASDRPSALLLALMDQLFGRALLPDHASCNDALTGLARRLLYIRANWLRMPPLLLARHLFHKAFITPRKAPQADAPPADI